MIGHGGSRAWLAALPVILLAGTAVAQSTSSGEVTGTPAVAAEPAPLTADANPLGIPDTSQVLPAATSREQVSTSLKIFVIMTVLTLAPSILVMTTSFARIMIVLALLRQAIGTQQLPPSQVLVGLSLFLTFLVMHPTYSKIYKEAIGPYLAGDPAMDQQRAWKITEGYMRDFMFDQIEHTRNEEDIYLFLEYARQEPIPVDQRVTRGDVGTVALVPAFILSELKTSFVMGFRMYLPFLVIDMVIATVLISMGMLMLPPVLISLPFKLLLFVLADGWHLVCSSLLNGFV